MPNNTIPILMYHSIDLVPRSAVMRGMHVTPKRFNFQMKMLNILGYKGLSLKKLKPYLDGKKTGKVVGLTFDDGYQNNLINAAPILQKYNFSATNYLVSQNIGFSNSWDIDKKITQQQLMTFNDIHFIYAFAWNYLREVFPAAAGAFFLATNDIPRISGLVRSCRLPHAPFFAQQKSFLGFCDMC